MGGEYVGEGVRGGERDGIEGEERERVDLEERGDLRDLQVGVERVPEGR